MILFFGPPGSGKSVQGEMLVERNGWQWLSTGALFRESKDPEVLKRLASGELIDDELTNKVLDEALAKTKNDIKVVLDGYPRNVKQAKDLDDFLTKHDREVSCIIVFHVPREELMRRLGSRGRAEDTPEVISRRLDIYEETTKPVVRFYRDDPDTEVIEIDGLGTPEEVHERIYEAVAKYVS